MTSPSATAHPQAIHMGEPTDPTFTVLYRWRLRPGMEQQFIEAWSRISELLLKGRGSLGSRLHRGTDGCWYSYAQWPDRATRDTAFSLPSVDPAASVKMREAVEEEFPELILSPVADYLVLRPDQAA